MEWQEKVVQIEATIFVERVGQKAILVGRSGAKLKQVGIDARRDIESLLEKQVMLRLWVKVKRGWSDDERALKSLGYGED
jgi:GTP-binding protein Era